jgi:hypothetical protein
MRSVVRSAYRGEVAFRAPLRRRSTVRHGSALGLELFGGVAGGLTAAAVAIYGLQVPCGNDAPPPHWEAVAPAVPAQHDLPERELIEVRISNASIAASGAVGTLQPVTRRPAAWVDSIGLASTIPVAVQGLEKLGRLRGVWQGSGWLWQALARRAALQEPNAWHPALDRQSQGAGYRPAGLRPREAKRQRGRLPAGPVYRAPVPRVARP